MESNKALIKTGMVSTPVIATGVLLAVQFFIAGFIGDMVISAGIFGAGYLTCYLKKKVAA